MQKLVKINHNGPIFPLHGIFGPVKTPMLLPLNDVIKLVDLKYNVIEVIKNHITGEVLGELELNKTNYKNDNFHLFYNTTEVLMETPVTIDEPLVVTEEQLVVTEEPLVVTEEPLVTTEELVSEMINGDQLVSADEKIDVQENIDITNDVTSDVPDRKKNKNFKKK